MESPLRDRILRHSRFAGCVRTFFQERGYAEVETPIVSPFLVPEPSLEVFETRYLPARGSPSPLWLAPSPELWMKRLLAGGSGSIFQISRCFRNCDYGGPHHNPEFRLLEWYTQGADYLLNIEVTEELFSRLLSERTVGQTPGRTAGRPAEELSPPFDRLTMQEAFQKFAGIDLSRCRDAGTMADEAARAGVTLEGSPTWEQSFHIAFLTLVEPRLPRKKPLVLLDYPALIPTTARRKPGTPWSERWELFVDGVEIANVYTEETDAVTLQAFVAAESARREGCRTHHAVDPDFAGLFPPGFPPCTGAALGMDRLEMVFSGQNSLEGVILFPFSSIVGAQSSTTG